MTDDDAICPECAGSGEGLLSPPGTGRCRRCKGTGTISTVEDDEPDPPDPIDDEEEERLRRQFRARGYNYIGKGKV